MKHFITFKIIPNSPKTKVKAVMCNQSVKIALKAEPEENKENQALLRYLSDILYIPISHIIIQTGETSKQKLISIKGLPYDTIIRRITNAI